MVIFVLHILKLNIIATCIILIVKLFATLLKGKVSARWKYFIWLLVTVNLLIPVQFSSNISLVDLRMQEQSRENLNLKSGNAKSESQRNIQNSTPQKSVQIPRKSTGSQKSYTIYETGKWMKTTAGIFMVIWLLIAVLKLMGEFLAYYTSMKKLERMSLPVSDPVSLKMYRDVCRNKSIRRKPQLRRNAGLTTPLLAGIFHTKLYLPAVGYSAEEKKLVFCHELTHYCHRDLWYKMLLRICASVYWFNPFLIVMLKEADRDLENLCDSTVVSNVGKEEHRLYRQLLLRTVAMENHIPYVTASLNDSGMVFKDRILYMLNMRKLRRGIIPGILVATLLAGGNLAFSVSAETAGTGQVQIGGEKTADTDKNSSSDTISVSEMVEMERIPDVQNTETVMLEADTSSASSEENSDKALSESTINGDSQENEPIEAGSDTDSSDAENYNNEKFSANVPYTSGYNTSFGVASIVAPGEGDTESRVIQDNGNGTYSDGNGFTYNYQGDGNWTDGDGNSYRTWNDEDYNSGTRLEQHELQGSNGTVGVKQTTNGDYYYRDANGIGYTDNGDGTWTDENGNTYTE